MGTLLVFCFLFSEFGAFLKFLLKDFAQEFLTGKEQVANAGEK